MGKKNKLRHARRELAVGRVSAVLAARAGASSRPVVASTFGDFDLADRQKIEAFRAHALRPPEDWRCRLKSRSLERRFIDLVRFTFAAFPVPAHLERVWVSEPDLVLADGAPACPAAAGDRPAHARDELLHWYIIAAQGRSLFKLATQRYLSKLETHHFLTAPPGLPAKRALWYAIARAHGADAGVARKIAQTRLADHAVASPFWREAARFFSRNPISIAEMDELIDYLRGTREQDPGFALKGRTLTSLRRRMLEWHRELRVQQTVCGGHWEGRALSDVDYETGLEHRRAVWRFRQIKTGNDLFREGQRMHHCVASYKWRCQAGQVSIWSLTCEYPLGHLNKGVTLEVRTDGAIVQCRGFANRLPHANEVTMVKRWAQEHGLRWEALER